MKKMGTFRWRRGRPKNQTARDFEAGVLTLLEWAQARVRDGLSSPEGVAGRR